MTNQAYSGHGSHQLIADFIINGKTGTIIFQPEGRKLFFEEGSLIFADSDNKSEKFQAIMVDTGLIDDQTLERVKSDLKKGESLGKRLKQEGLVDSKQLAGSLKQQITVVVEEVFKRAEGSYRVLDVLPAKVPHLKIQTMALVVRSLSRLENYDYHEDHTRFSKSAHFEDRLTQLDFPDSQTRLLDYIREQDHCSAEGLSDHFKIDPKVTHGLLYTLELLGLLEPAVAEDQDDDDEDDDLLIVEEEEDDLNLEDGEDIKTQPSITPEVIAASAGVAGLAVAARAAQAMEDGEDGDEDEDEEELTVIDDDEDTPVDDDDTIHVNEDEEDPNFTNADDENEETLTMVDQEDETLTMVDGDEEDDQDALSLPEEEKEEEAAPSYEENTLPGVHEPRAKTEPDASLLEEEEVSLEVDDDESQEEPIDPSEQSGDALADILPEGNTEPGEVTQDDDDPVLESAEDTFENEAPSEAERHAQSDQSDPHDINTDNYLAAPEDDEEDEDELLTSPERDPDNAIEETPENLKTVAIPNAKERLDQHLAEMEAEESHEVSQEQGSVQSLNEALNDMSDAEEPDDDDFEKAGAELDDDDDIDAPQPSQDPNATLAVPPEASFGDDAFDIPRREPPKWDDEDLNSPITAGAYEETGETAPPEASSATPPKRKPMWLLVGILIVAVLGALSLFIPLPTEEAAPATTSEAATTTAPQRDPQPEPAATQPPAEPDPSPIQSTTATEATEQPKNEAETQAAPEPQPTVMAASPTPDPEPQEEPEPASVIEEDGATAITEDPAPMTAEVSVPPRSQSINTADLEALTEDAVSRLRQSEGRYSVALLVACQQETIDKIMAKHGSDQIFVFPRSLSGRTCYMVTWGLYTSRKAALTARDADVPDSLYNPEDPGWVVNLDSYRE